MLYSSNAHHQIPAGAEGAQRTEPPHQKQCPGCQQMTPANGKFCMNCGAELVATDTEPAENVEHVKRLRKDTFPDLRTLMPRNLMEKAQEEAQEIQGERRDVTVLFLDVTNFTATTTTMDNEDVYYVMDEALQLLAEVVYDYEGIIDKYTGDGLMALFGAPIAHENDPERAVRAALEMQKILQPFRLYARDKYGFDFQARIGINTGSVIAGRMGSDSHFEYTVIGDTVNLAARLESAAEPGGVLVSFETYQRTQPLFQYKMLPPFQVKGFSEAVTAARPMCVGDNPMQQRGFGHYQAPIIGRTHSLEQLREALSVVQQTGSAQAVMLTGQAGLGKSRIVNEFTRQLTEEAVPHHKGYCLNYARAKPYWVVADMLRNIFAISESASSEEQLAKFTAGVTQLGLSEKEIVPPLLPILGLASSAVTEEMQTKGVDAAMLQRQTYGALVQIVKAVASQGPLALVFEDLHWVDSASASFVDYIIGISQELPILFILIARSLDEPVEGLVSAAKKLPNATISVQLESLTETEGRDLLDNLIPQKSDDAIEVKRKIAERADGIPFYIEELVRMLADNQALLGVPGAWHVTPEAQQVLESIPGTLIGLILARYDRLPEHLRVVVQKAAVIGRSFPEPLISALTGESSEVVSAYLAELVERRFLADLGNADEPAYIFQHALVQEAVYGTLLSRNRTQIHGRIAKVVESGTFWVGVDRSEFLAHHYSNSTQPELAIPYLIAAAAIAEQRSASHNALSFYRQASDLIAQHDIKEPQQHCTVQIGLARSLKFVGEYREAEQTLRAALDEIENARRQPGADSLLHLQIDGLWELADTLAKAGSLEQATLYLKSGLDLLGSRGRESQPRLWQQIMERRAWVEFQQHQLEDAMVTAESALIPLPKSTLRDSAILGSIYNIVAGIFWKQGYLPEAVEALEQSRIIYQELDYTWGLVIVASNLGVLHFTQGNWKQATTEFERGLSLADKISDLHHKAQILDNLGNLYLHKGQFEEALQYVEESLQIRERLGESWGMANSHLHLAQLYLATEEFKLAEEHAELALELATLVDFVEVQVGSTCILALTSAQKGSDGLEGCLSQVQQSRKEARAAALTAQEADCLRVLGMLYSFSGESSSARELLQESVALSSHLNDRYRVGVALLELGRTYRQLLEMGSTLTLAQPVNLTTEAVKAVSQARDYFEKLGANHDFEQANELLAALGSEPFCAADNLADEQEEMRSEAAESFSENSPRAVNEEAVERGKSASVQLFRNEKTQHRNRNVASSDTRSLKVEENRYSTVIWFVLVPNTSADPELIHDTQTIIFRGLANYAEQEEGFLLRQGDGVGVVFGTPNAHEDDPQRAVRTAWYLLQELKKLPAELELPFSIHGGISYGQVMAAFHEDSQEVSLSGQTLAEAERLARSAPAGHVWVTVPVQTATQAVFEYRLLNQNERSNLPAGIERAAELLQTKKDSPEGLSGSGEESQFFGRESELASMRDFSARLQNGLGGAIFVKGEMGIGKSRLIHQFINSQTASNVQVLHGQASPQQDSQPFGIITDLLSRLFNTQVLSQHGSTVQVGQLARQQCVAENRLAGPILDMLSGQKLSEADAASLSEIEPDQLQKQIFLTIRHLLKFISKQTPTIIVLDDIQWLDQWSSELIIFVSSLTAELPILFVCAYRDANQDPTARLLQNAEMRFVQNVLHVSLEGLPEGAARALLDQSLQIAVPENVREQILLHSAGSPYHLQQYVQMLDERLTGQDGEQMQMDCSEIQLPRSLNALIRSRVDRLPAAGKALLEYAAVFGRNFTQTQLQAFSQLPNVEDEFQLLASRNMVEYLNESNHWRIPQQALQQEVYNAIAKPRRKEMHAQVAQVLEDLWADNLSSHAAELAHHYTEAELDIRALEYLCLTGEWAVICSGTSEALKYFEKAATIAKENSDVPEKLSWRIYAGLGDVHRLMGNNNEAVTALKAGLAATHSTEISAAQRAGLYRRLGECFQSQGKLDEARQYYTIALTELQGETEADSCLELARGQLLVAWTHFMQGDVRNAFGLARKGAKQAGQLNSSYLQAMAENMLGGIYYQKKDLDASIQHTRNALKLREEAGFTWGVASTSCNLGVLSTVAGDWQEAKAQFERSLALRVEFGDVEGITISHQNLGYLSRDQGDFETAEDHFRRAIDLAENSDLGYQLVSNSLGLAQVCIMTHDLEEANQLINAAATQTRTIGASDMMVEISLLEVELLLVKGDHLIAFDKAQKAAAMAATTSLRQLETTAYRLYATSALGIGNLKEARRSIERAETSLTKLMDKLEAGRVALVDSQISLAEGDGDRAAEKSEQARSIFEKLGARYDLAKLDETALGETQVANGPAADDTPEILSRTGN